MTTQDTDIPEWWIETTLGEVVEITSSKRIFAEEYKTSWVPFYRWKEIIEKFKWWEISTELYITEEKYSEIYTKFWAPKWWEMLLTSVGTIWVPYIVREDERFYFKDWNLTWFKGFSKVFNKFLYYWIVSPIWQYEIQKRKIGSTQEALTIVWLKSVPIVLPPLTEQKEIASILSSFDKKIELLRKQNETLEKTAQTIFQEWFIDFSPFKKDLIESDFGLIPRGWKNWLLCEISEITSWKRPQSINDTKTALFQYPLIGATRIMWFVEDYLFEGKSLVIGRVWTHGEIQKFNERIYPSDNTLVIKSDFFMFVYFILKWIDYEKLNRWAVQPLITQADLKNYKIIIPSDTVMSSFSSAISPIFERIEKNNLQISTLTNTRDLILPKLMNWEIRL